MDNNNLYPGASVTAIERGSDYVDYLLSSVLQNNGYRLSGVIMHFACGPVQGFDEYNRPKQVKCLIAEGRIDDSIESVAIAPLYEGRGSLTTLEEYSDLRIRYYLHGDSVSRPVWISVFSGPDEIVEIVADNTAVLPHDALSDCSLFFIRDDYDNKCGMSSDFFTRIE